MAVSPIEESPTEEEPSYLFRDTGWSNPAPSQGQLISQQPRRRRRMLMTDRESADFYNQVKTRRRQIMKQRSSMMSGSADDEVDWAKYDPPEALSKLPNITSETIIAIAQSSLENIKNQIQAETLRAQEQGHPNLKQADAEPAAAEAEEIKGEEDASSDCILTTSELERAQHPTALGTPGSANDSARQPLKSQKRARFGGISRILRHVRGNSESSKSESSSNHPAIVLLHTRPGSNDLAPSPFTQSIYRRLLKPSSPASAGGEQRVECVSCLDDIPKKDAIKAVCHHYCTDCFSRLVQTAVDNEAQWPPKCCLNPVPFRTIAIYVSAELLAAYRLKNEEFKTPVELRLYCPRPDCGAWIRRERQDAATRTATCPAGHAVCTMCRGPAHQRPGASSGAAALSSSSSCPQDRDTQLADRLAEEQGWRRCAGCGVLVEHRDACQHMTCRCGAEFCYVCGAAWRTCACGMEQLAEVKERAARRRRERTTAAGEATEEREVAEALRLVEEFEREEGRKRELRLVEARRLRQERRRREAEERTRREAGRRAGLDRKYAELVATLRKVRDLQRMVLDYGHDREMEALAHKAAAEKSKLAAGQAAERRELRAAAAAKAAEREAAFDREYAARSAWERQLEEDYERAVESFWSDKIGGLPRATGAVKAFMRKNDRRMDEWRAWRDGEMEKTRCLLDEEVVIREELMEASGRRLDDTGHGAGRGRAEQRAEQRWFELVIEERERLLAEVEVVERGNGGEDESQGSASRMSSGMDSAWETDDNFDEYVVGIEC